LLTVVKFFDLSYVIDSHFGMYGKHFESMYEGSMYGAGVAVFAVWGYVIAHTKRSRVELNPKKLADTLGGDEAQIRDAIDFLCKPDKGSRNQTREGRRLIKEGSFQFYVTGWEEYQMIRNEEERREYNKLAKRAERARKKREDDPRSEPLNGEVDSIIALENGTMTQEQADARAALTREG